MPTFETERQLIREIRGRLDGWLFEAREEAYRELFEGPDAVLTEDELLILDRLDSRLSRAEGRGLWGVDEYAIIPTGSMDEESAPRVVCTNHPQVPEDLPRAEAQPGLRTKLNETLWEYCQRVVEIAQQRLEEFVWSSHVETWED